MLIGENLRGIDETFDYIFEALLPLDVLKELIDKENVRPRPPPDSTKSELTESLVKYTVAVSDDKELHSKEDYRKPISDFLIEHIDKNKIESSLKEPEYEDDLTPLARQALKSCYIPRENRYIHYTPYPNELRIGYSPELRSGYSVADVVGHRPRYDTKTKRVPRKIGPIQTPLWKKIQTRKHWYEFCGIELKTAKRNKDSLFRQIEDYIQYFDYSFTTITPFSFLSNLSSGYLQKKLYFKCESEGMGIILIDRTKVIGTILEAKEKSPIEENTKYLEEKIGLE